MIKTLILPLVACIASAPLDAQVRTPPRKAPTATKPAKPPVAKPQAPPVTATPRVPTATKPGKTAAKDTVRQASRWRPYGFSAFTAEVFDSNIDREREDPTRANGFVIGGVVRYQSAESRPGFAVAYEAARHSYTASEQFDRISQNLSVVLSRRLTKQVTAETIGEAALKGSSEDRDVGNQFLFLPRLNYRLDAARRLRAFGAYRIRRYETNPDRDAANRYVGAELRSDVGRHSRVDVGYRYETNSARSERRSYVRRTYSTGLERSFGRNDDMFAELKFRSQRYPKRLVEVDDEDVPRHDYRLTPTLEWNHRFGAGFSLIANYNFENRTSNDPDNGYLDHVFALTGRYDW
ncbi:MAG: hypothetical protein WKF55_04285 [Gemmatimonadaceae bacterium]